MKYCTRCGAVCSDDAAFCKECGNPFSQNSQGNPSGSDYQSNAQNYNSSSGQNYNPNYGQNYNSGQNYNQNYGQNYNSGQNYNQNYNQNYGQNYNYAQGAPNYAPSHHPGISPRSIPLCILFTLITCGIYGIYWMIKMNDEINLLAGEPNATSGGMVFLFSIITCGIYSFYWMYKMGERADRIKRVNGNSALLYLLLSIFGLAIVSYCLIQDTINKAV